MKTSNLWKIIVAMLPIIGSLALITRAEMVVLTKNSDTNRVARNIPVGLRVIDMSGDGHTRSADANEIIAAGLEPSAYPAVIDRDSGAYVHDTDLTNALARLPAAIAASPWGQVQAETAAITNAKTLGDLQSHMARLSGLQASQRGNQKGGR